MIADSTTMPDSSPPVSSSLALAGPARRILGLLAEATDRTGFACRLVEAVEELLDADTVLLVLSDRATGRPTVFGGTRDQRVRVGGALRASPGTPGSPQFPVEALGVVGGSTLVLPLEHGHLRDGLLVAHRARPFGPDEAGMAEFIAEVACTRYHAIHLVEQLDRTRRELRQARERQLHDSRLQALGELAAGVAHDIKNAMSPVTAFSSILLTSDDLPAEARTYLELIEQSGDDVLRILDRMRELYSGREETAMRPVEVAPLFHQVAELSRPSREAASLAQGGRIELRIEVASDLPLVLGEASSLREMLLNLVLNATHALRGEGVIVLRARAENRHHRGGGVEREVGIEIVDDGPGMDADTLRRCTDPFFTTKGADGSGLGLAQVQRIVREHAGRFRIDSAPGRGTRVFIALPCAVAPRPTVDPETGSPVEAFPSLRILCVDDDPIQLELLRAVLEADGHDVVTAVGGQAGVRTFVDSRRQDDRFDMAITDLGMPDLSGHAVTAAMREIDPDLPIIIATAWDLHAAGDRLIEHAARVLEKPIRPDQLRQAIRAVVQG